jgi:uncharacterized membrane-anchored protein
MTLSFRTRFFLLVGWQIFLLLALMASKSIVVATGITVVLRTVPVDPRELFRGDYVVLRYDISQIDLTRVANRLQKPRLQRGDAAYVVLVPSQADERQPWQAVAVFSRPPTDEELAEYGRDALSLQASVVRHQGSLLDLEYGIESYFVPEGEGHVLEREAGKGLRVEVKVDRRGRAVIQRVLRATRGA